MLIVIAVALAIPTCIFGRFGFVMLQKNEPSGVVFAGVSVACAAVSAWIMLDHIGALTAELWQRHKARRADRAQREAEIEQRVAEYRDFYIELASRQDEVSDRDRAFDDALRRLRGE